MQVVIETQCIDNAQYIVLYVYIYSHTFIWVVSRHKMGSEKF